MRVQKTSYMCKRYICKPATCSCKNGKYLADIMEDSVITCDEIREVDAKSYKEETKTIPKNLNEKEVACKA